MRLRPQVQRPRLFPQAFEFDGRLLLLLAHHAHSCRFGTFLGNSERERLELQLHVKTPSIWPFLEQRSELFRSAAYDPSAGDVLLPHPAGVLRHVQVWSDWFLRWAFFPSSPRTSRMEKYAEGVYDRAPLLAAMLPPAPGTAAPSTATLKRAAPPGSEDLAKSVNCRPHCRPLPGPHQPAAHLIPLRAPGWQE